MKKLWIIVVALGVFTACDNKPSEPDSVTTDLVNNPASAAADAQEVSLEDYPVMEFESIAEDFGTITQGEKVRRNFKFTNTGKSELLISSARGSCGCTVPVWPKHPIAPGESGAIEVVFNSEGKLGRQHKKIYIVANTNPASNTLAISGDVKGPAEKE